MPVYTPFIDLGDTHFIYEYSGISIDKLLLLDIYEYRVLLINAFVHQANQTEEGRQMLKDYTNTYCSTNEFNTSDLRDLFG